MKNIKSLSLLFLIFSLLFCCCDSKNKSFYNRNINILIKKNRKKIHFTDNLRIYNNPSLIFCDSSSKITVISIIMMECVPCIIELKNWMHFIQDNPIYKRANVIFIATGNETEYFNYQVNSQNDFPFLIYNDKGSEFIKANELYEFGRETFLLNSDNEIILVGSPIKNEKLNHYYKKNIINQTKK